MTEDAHGHRVTDSDFEYSWLSSVRPINIIAKALKQIDYLSDNLKKNW